MNINVTGNYSLVLDSQAFIMNTANIYLQCKTAGAPVNITLPRITPVGGATNTWGFKIYVNDVDNNASVNNITLIPHPADKINGTLTTPVVLSTNGVTGHIQIAGGNSWEFSLGSSSSGGGITTPNKTYQALLTQSSTISPSANIQNDSDSNYLGLPNVVWTRLTTGRYNGFKLGAFPDGKVQVYIGNNTPNASNVGYDKLSGDSDNIIVSTSYQTSGYNKLLRLNPDGGVDSNFLQISGFNNDVYGMAEQADGKIIVVGTFTSYDGSSANRIVRLNADGTIDNTFVIGTGFNDEVYDVAIQADGKIIVVGIFNSYNGSTARKIARLNTNGSLDSFTAVTPFGGTVTCLAIQSDGKVIFGGDFSGYDGNFSQNLFRANSNGTYDAVFFVDSGFDGFVNSIAIQSDGKVIVGGAFSLYQGVTPANKIIRLNGADATPDTYTVGTGFSGIEVHDIKIQPADGKAVVVGQITHYDGVPRSRIARLNTDGTLDLSFVVGSGFNQPVWTVAIQADGKIVTGGEFTTYQGLPANKLLRLTTLGAIDNPDNLGNIPYSDMGLPSIYDIKIQADQKILTGGTFVKTFAYNYADSILNETPIMIIVKP